MTNHNNLVLHVSTSVTVFDNGDIAVSLVTKKGTFLTDRAESIALLNAQNVVDSPITFTHREVTSPHGSDVHYFRGRKST